PGGDLSATIGPPRRPDRDFSRFVQLEQARLPWLPAALLHRWARLYGSRIGLVVGEACSLDELGAEVAPGLHEAEVRYLMREEWARDAADVLWRRTKLGLRLNAAETARVENWMRAARAGVPRFCHTVGVSSGVPNGND
ncbi:MAG: glycerol-3-phosphate dehydrogenase C-terminal domain-containing protein, partial [Gammaproteobacteria bacterium]